jgi:HlyD family secretion protein
MKAPGLLRNKMVVGAILLTAIAAIAFFAFGGASNKPSNYSFVTISKGTIESTISSTGTLNPVTEITVGTQVSGTIQKVYVDFNQKVKKGQIIAVLDSALLQMAVANAEADLLKAQATYEEARFNYEQSEQLSQKSLISETNFQSVKTALKSAEAGLKTAKTALQRAGQNLSYAIIRAPIDGTITERSVEEGQTVAASFSTPTLFTIAQDLSKMEIKATVDESDIGQIKEGQTARFTVQAFPTKTFEGRVKQVRLKPTTSSNVVNYTVVVSASNNGNLLMPGMTATVEFVIARKTDVLIVPNAALRFQPLMSPPPPPGNGSDEWKRVWYLDNNGKIAPAPLQVGISDGSRTEIVGGQITEGMKIISESEAQTTTPAQSRSSDSGPPPPMM